MQKRKVILKILLLRNFFPFCLLFFSIDFYGCPEAFGDSRSVQGSLFDSALPQTKSPQTVQHSADRRPAARRRAPKLTKQQQTKIDITNSFVKAFRNRDFIQMNKLVTDFPFLKSLRLKTNSLLLKDYMEDLTVLRRFPEGISFPTIAVYSRDLEMLNHCLKMGLEIRTIKRKKRGSIEPNPLHVAIGESFYLGAEMILRHEGRVSPWVDKSILPSGKKTRLIDEKDEDTLTPWALAIETDMRNGGEPEFVHLIGKYHPSGYVESYVSGTRKDGFVLAKATGQSQFTNLAYRYLWAPNYQENKEKKRLYGKRTTSPH